jgi:hypothetical protein
MIYYPPPRDQGLQHLAEQLVPVVQRYGGMSTPAQYFAAHTRYYPQLMLFITLALFAGLAVFWAIRLHHLSQPVATDAADEEESSSQTDP